MPDKNTIDGLKTRLRELEEERKTILKLLSLWNGQAPNQIPIPMLPKVASTSARGKVIDATLELINKHGRAVSNEEILEYVEQKGIDVGKTDNKGRTIGSMLSQECKKTSARLRRVERGLYYGYYET